tara:strand:+ start:231 stop:713 length:483 start_codon:yes stop_codon:yes gene_type:complete
MIENTHKTDFGMTYFANGQWYAIERIYKGEERNNGEISDGHWWEMWESSKYGDWHNYVSGATKKTILIERLKNMKIVKMNTNDIVIVEIDGGSKFLKHTYKLETVEGNKHSLQDRMEKEDVCDDCKTGSASHCNSSWTEEFAVWLEKKTPEWKKLLKEYN